MSGFHALDDYKFELWTKIHALIILLPHKVIHPSAQALMQMNDGDCGNEYYYSIQLFLLIS